MAKRLREATIDRNSRSSHRFALTFSVGYVTSTLNGHESLQALLSKADAAMYEEKRLKKADLA
jgi:GGDEF domain-containing protein